MKENPEADKKLRMAAIKLDLSDSESLQKEKEYQAEEKKFWNRILRRIRPNHAQWTRQDALYNIDHNPEMALPLKAFEAINDVTKTAQALASEELKAQGVDEKIAQKTQPILEAIAVESYKNYTEYVPDKDEQYFQFYLNKEKNKKVSQINRKLLLLNYLTWKKLLDSIGLILTLSKRCPTSESGLLKAPVRLELIMLQS